MSAIQPYLDAYPFLEDRRGVWREVARHVRRDVPDAGTVVELGAGYCDFINAFPAPRRIAFDLNPRMVAHVDDRVELRIGDARELPGLEEGSVDLFFASNFLEHLEWEELDALLPRIHRALTPRGRLVLIQPNHRLCADRYFDDPTHRTVFDDEILPRWLSQGGFEVTRLVPGFLPFSMNSRLPKWRWLIRMYLASPWKPLAAQMYVVAERADVVRQVGVGGPADVQREGIDSGLHRGV